MEQLLSTGAMADNRIRHRDTLEELSRLSSEHEVLLLKRQAIIQIQKYKDIKDSSRLAEIS